jgi:hypothetical protein
MIDRLALRLGGIPLAGAAVTLIVALTLWQQNSNRLGYEHALPPIVASVTLAITITVALRLLLGGWARAGIASGLIAAFVFYSMPIAEVISSARMVIAAVLLLFVLLLVLLLGNLPRGEQASAVNGKLNLLLLPALLAIGATATYAQVQLESRRPATAMQFDRLSGRASADSPDVWHILFDRYASRETLEERYQFDNGPFFRELEKRGFTIGDGNFSNYQRTAHSVAATLNGADLDRLARRMQAQQTDWVPIYRAIADNEATAFFTANGYRSVFAGTWWSPTRVIGSTENINYRSLPELGRVMLDQSVLSAGMRGLGLPFGDSRREQCQRETFKFHRLEQLAAEPGRKHVFAHFLVPHPPFVFNADGSCRSLDQARAATRRDNYVGQVQYANARALRLVDAILKSSRPAVIVIHSDEGPWPEPYVGDEHGLGTDPVSVNWENVPADKLREKMGVLMAVRSPSGPPATMPASPAQIYPAILRDHFGSGQPLKPSRHRIFANDGALYRFVDVSAKLKAPPRRAIRSSARSPANP